MKRIVIPVVSLFILASCSQSGNHNQTIRQKKQKYTIDSLINKERKLIAMAKLKGQEAIVSMSKAQTADVEIVYNVFKNQEGKIVYISEMPKSTNDDWFIAYKSYFDENGKLFAFQRQNNFFHSECTTTAALENLVKYYNDTFEVIDSTYTLTDSYKKDLQKADCKFPYNFQYKIYSSVDEYKEHVKGL